MVRGGSENGKLAVGTDAMAMKKAEMRAALVDGDRFPWDTPAVKMYREWPCQEELVKDGDLLLYSAAVEPNHRLLFRK